MNETDITQNGIPIKRIINVIKTRNPNIRKFFSVENRHSDAFVYILSGSCDYYFKNGNSFTARKGDILYLANGSAYTMYIPSDDYRFIFCDFEFDSDAQSQSDLYSSKELSDTVEGLFRKLFQAHKTVSPSSFSEEMSLLYEIYTVIVKIKSSEYVEPSAKNKALEAKKYIDSCFQNPDLSVSEIAEKVQISEVYLRKLFKAQYHISPSQYIISVRLKKAKELMRYPFLTVEECALQSGFSSHQYFCRIFKKRYGQTPHRFKE